MLVGRLLTNGAMNARAVIALSEDWTFKMNAQVGAKKCFCMLQIETYALVVCELISGSQIHNIEFLQLKPVPSKGLARHVLKPFVFLACPLFDRKGSFQCPLYGRVLSPG